MADAKTETPAEELRAAAVRLRSGEHHGEIVGDCENDELLALIAALLKAREPLAALFEHYAAKYELVGEMFGGVPSRPDVRLAAGKPALHVDFALAVARVLNGTTS